MREKLITGSSLSCSGPCSRSLLALVALCLLALFCTSEAFSAPPKDTDVVATFTGGKITVGELIAYAGTYCPPRSICTFSNEDEHKQTLVRSAAIRSILLKKAQDMKLREHPGWKVADKLIGQLALAEFVILTEAWEKVPVTTASLAQAQAQHSDLLVNHETGEVPAIPSFEKQLDFLVRMRESDHLLEPVRQQSLARFPLVLADPDKYKSLPDDAAAVSCGDFEMSKLEVTALAELCKIHVSRVEDFSQIHLIRVPDLPLGQWGKAANVGGSAKYQAERKRLEEAFLQELAKREIRRSLLAAHEPDEEQIRSWYDSNYHADEPPMVEFDALVVPYSIASNAEGARKQAEEALSAAKAGASLLALKEKNPSFLIVPRQRASLVKGSSSALVKMLGEAKRGQILPSLVDEFGGFSVISITDKANSRKMPLEWARANILEILRFNYARSIDSDFDEVLLQMNAFTAKEAILKSVLVRETGTGI